MRIAHASISENGTVNGAKGDQTGKEVCIREWYSSASKPWKTVLRYPNEDIAKKIASIAETLAKCDYIGYSQNDRNSLYKAIEQRGFDVNSYINSKTPTNTDCSAFATCVAVCAGINALKYYTNAPTTRTMTMLFTKAGFEAITDSGFLKSPDYLQQGDILVRDGHTVICIDSGAKACVQYDAIYYPRYEGGAYSLVEGLRAVGEKDTSLAHRKQIALINGYSDYTGTANQNTRLLKMLKDGFLVKELV